MSGPQHLRDFEQVQEPCASLDHPLVNDDSDNQNILINIDSDIVLETLEEEKDCNQPVFGFLFFITASRTCSLCFLCFLK